ncbi:TetR/AcrR family transcriptional regulator [Acetobacter sp.]|uniref:TetR/AcrR family transcriptional regulator n=1 Tax=Acetobacter sp. TaxID=440 RepID=UPI0039EC9C49
MARPRDDDKKRAILIAAIRLFADEGLGASTASIARAANVADGTLFRYFPTKDHLLNELYSELKLSLRARLAPVSHDTSLREQLRSAWDVYIDWGFTEPAAHQVTARLSVSTRISARTRADAAEAFSDVNSRLKAAVANGPLRRHPTAFAGALFAAMADTTLAFIIDTPAERETLTADGFAAFWSAIGRGNSNVEMPRNSQQEKDCIS